MTTILLSVCIVYINRAELWHYNVIMSTSPRGLGIGLVLPSSILVPPLGLAFVCHKNTLR